MSLTLSDKDLISGNYAPEHNAKPPALPEKVIKPYSKRYQTLTPIEQSY